jgi:hypothetical protein
MRCLALALVAVLPVNLPDLLPPGGHPVQHELVLDWSGAPEGARFVASPSAGLHGHHVIARGEPFRFSSKYGTRIFAVPPGASLPPAREALREVDWPSAGVPVTEIGWAARGNPLRSVRTSLRVERADARTLELRVCGVQRFGPLGLAIDGPIWLPLAAIGAIGAIWLARLVRASPRPQP